MRSHQNTHTTLPDIFYKYKKSTILDYITVSSILLFPVYEKSFKKKNLFVCNLQSTVSIPWSMDHSLCAILYIAELSLQNVENVDFSLQSYELA